MTPPPGLTAQDSPDHGHFYPLQAEETIIGRSGQCTLVVDWEPSVSRQHARIVQQSGLYWLEDLGSSNGTYLTPFGGEERKLLAKESVLLLDGALIRLGRHVKFLVTGLIADQDEAVQMVTARLKQIVTSLYAGLAHLQPEDREAQLEYLRGFEARLRDAKSREEILRIASEGTQTLFGTLHFEPAEAGDLPPLPEGVPDPETGNHPPSILGFLDNDIWKHFPKEDDQDG